MSVIKHLLECDCLLLKIYITMVIGIVVVEHVGILHSLEYQPPHVLSPGESVNKVMSLLDYQGSPLTSMLDDLTNV